MGKTKKSTKKTVPKGWVINARNARLSQMRPTFKPRGYAAIGTGKKPDAEAQRIIEKDMRLGVIYGKLGSKPSRVFMDKEPLDQVSRAAWLNEFISAHAAKARVKFIKGSAEHQCDFGEQSVEYLLDAIMEEVIDQLFYIAELKRRLVR